MINERPHSSAQRVIHSLKVGDLSREILTFEAQFETSHNIRVHASILVFSARADSLPQPIGKANDEFILRL